MRHGRGVYIDSADEAQKYEGEWSDDMMQGRGTFRYASGATYEVRDKTNGPISLAAARALISGVPSSHGHPFLAQGEFAANKYNGHGVFIFPDGSMYEGPFQENQMHGLGKFTDAQGVVWSGKFYNGNGPGLGQGTVVAK